ncbi:MAG: hypothetical protein EAZ09_11940, partial [Oscillatoriales cyanobacterium]
MPVPQRVNFLVLTSCTIFNNRQDACSTKSEFSGGVGILPAQRRLIDTAARYHFIRLEQLWLSLFLLIVATN